MYKRSKYVPGVKSFIFDEKKIQRGRRKIRQKLQKEEFLLSQKMHALHFDGKQNENEVMKGKIDGKF